MCGIAGKVSHHDPAGAELLARMCEAVRQLPVVREQERSGRVHVEASYGNDARAGVDQLEHGPPALGVTCRRHHAGGLVQQQMRERLLPHNASVDLDDVARLDDGVQLAGFSVDPDATRLDQLVSPPPRRDAAAGEERIETHPRIVAWVGSPSCPTATSPPPLAWPI